MSDNVDVTCPCCETRLVVDAATGEILSEERPKVDLAKTFDSAMDEVRGGAERRGDAFTKAFEKTRRLDDLLDKKFEESKKKAAKDDTKPINPLDFD